MASRKTPSTNTRDNDVIAALHALLGPAYVECALESRVFYSTDMSRRGEVAFAVIAPGTPEQVARAAALCTDEGFAVIPRGGGFSYTGGYLPITERSIIIDMRRLQSIEIDPDNMIVTVGAGVTWHDLYQALKGQGLRTPYFGPMSGYGATIGGALSQGSFFLGSTQYGPVADSVLAVEVALADGSLIRTGSWAGTTHPSAFYRSYGPDLTGMFLGDTGAFGLKTRAALKLIAFPQHQRFASAAFETGASGLAALSEIARAGIAAECYLWDPYFVKQMADASQGLADDLKFLGGVVKTGGWRGLVNGARLATGGKAALSGQYHVLNVTIDDFSSAGAEARLAAITAIAARHGGAALTPAAPMAMRGTPFTDFNAPARRAPRRNLPTNGLISHGEAPATLAELRALIDREKPALAAVGAEAGMICFAVGGQAVCIEPITYWDDPEHFLHDRTRQVSDLKGLGAHADRPAATKAALAMRAQFAAIFAAHGAAHVQIGKSYPWLATRMPGVAGLVRNFKAAVDPRGLVNPGSLGLM